MEQKPASAMEAASGGSTVLDASGSGQPVASPAFGIAQDARSTALSPTAVEVVSAAAAHLAPCELQPSTSAQFSPSPGESTRAFEAFCTYLELGPRRRYSAVAQRAGVSVRTVARWADQFDWRERITSRAAQGAEHIVQTREAERIETGAREQSLRERRVVLAEAIVNLTERYFERLDDMDLEHIRLPEVCRALEIASRLADQPRESAPAATAETGLRDQLAALLDQAFREKPQAAAAAAVES